MRARVHCACDCVDLLAYVVQIKNVSGYCSLRKFSSSIIRGMKGLSEEVQSVGSSLIMWVVSNWKFISRLNFKIQTLLAVFLRLVDWYRFAITCGFQTLPLNVWWQSVSEDSIKKIKTFPMEKYHIGKETNIFDVQYSVESERYVLGVKVHTCNGHSRCIRVMFSDPLFTIRRSCFYTVPCNGTNPLGVMLLHLS